MRMARHRIPYTARHQCRHTHYQLAALHLSRQNIFVDHSVIGFFQCSKLYFIFFFDDHNPVFRFPFEFDQNRRIGSMRRNTVDIEFCGILRILTLEYNVFCTHSDIHTVFVINRIFSAIYYNRALCSDIDDSHFSSLQKIFCAKLLSRCQSDRGLRHAGSCNNTINVAVYQLDFSRNK